MCAYFAPCTQPKRLRDVKENIRGSFCGYLWLLKDKDRDLSSYFVEYDYYEIYDENKGYTMRNYLKVYDNGKEKVMREYQNYLCTLEEEGIEHYYVLSKRIFNEYDNLAPFCPCKKCTSYFSSLYCSHCCKCLKLGKTLADESYLHLAQINKEKIKLNDGIKPLNFLKKTFNDYKKLIWF